MFSNHLQKIHSVPRKYIYLGAVVVVLVGMLTGIASVASEQVKKAELRESLLASQRTAIAYCVEVMRGAALNHCVQRARADADGAQTTVMVANTAGFNRGVAAASTGVQGLVPVVLTAYR